MSVLDNLAPDQRAVLQMVLQRGRSYDEIASLLSIDRTAVRPRALDAFDALAPVLPGPESALITDYLLGQLPERVAEQVYSYLQASEADREWARALAQVIAPLSASLPEIPVGAPLGADPGASGGLERDSDAPVERPDAQDTADFEQPVHEDRLASGARDTPAAATAVASAATAPVASAVAARPSSRRGGAILLGSLGAAIVAVVLIVALSSGGNGKHRTGASHPNASTNTTVSQDTATGETTATTGTGTGVSAQILAQLNLTSPTGAKSTLGIVQVVRAGGAVGIVLRAQGMPPNTAHNAYAVWLYNSPSSYRFVGFVQYLVGKNGLIDTEGRLKPGAAAYHHLLITLETRQHPSTPGEVVLSGPFREHS
jgi:hypothetical protein